MDRHIDVNTEEASTKRQLILESQRIQQHHLFGAVLSGILLTGAFPKFDLFLLAWIALVPLLISIRTLSAWDRFRVGLLAGVVHYVTLMYWIAPTIKTYGGVPWVLSVAVLLLFSVYLGTYVGLFSTLLPKVSRTPLTIVVSVPALWVSLEYIRALLLTGFPWELLGYTQYRSLQIIQIAEIFGVYGVSFLIAFGNGCFFIAWLHLKKADWYQKMVTGRQAAIGIVGLILILGGVYIYGKTRIEFIQQQISSVPAPMISIVQGNISQDVKWDPAFLDKTVETYVSLSESARVSRPHLVVWPETATPFYFLHERKHSRKVLQCVRDLRTDFLIGSPSYEQRSSEIVYYNSAYLVNSRGKVVDKYHKSHLVPFGEYVPLKKWLPFIGKIVTAVGDFEPGPVGKTIPWRRHEIGIQICYEMIFSRFSRLAVNNGANLLLNITNDAWYGRSSAPYQLFSMSVFRAIENRRSVVRSANTGISGFIEPTGFIRSSTPLFEEKALSRSVPLLKLRTTYGNWGDWFPLICCFWVVGLMILYRLFDLKKHRRNEDGF